MGMYTEINACFDLYDNTSKEVVDVLHSLYKEYEDPTLVYIEDGKAVLKGVEVDEYEEC